LRRQTELGGSLSAGSSRCLRLDPFALPVRFSAEDAAADGRTRWVEIDRDRVLVQRTVRGIRMRLNLPLAAFLGVAVRLLPARVEQDDAIAIVLEHRDSTLSVPLHVANETDDIVADWQVWGRVLRQRLLVAEGDGTLRQPFATIGTLMLGQVVRRRRRRSALKGRRPMIFSRRAQTRLAEYPVVHRGEREIIAPE
jgi:hypothetical protein